MNKDKAPMPGDGGSGDGLPPQATRRAGAPPPEYDISRMSDFPTRNAGHRRAHSEILSLPDDLDLSAPVGGDGPSLSDENDEELSMFLDVDKLNSSCGASLEAEAESSYAAGGGGEGADLSPAPRPRHQYSQSMDESMSIKAEQLVGASGMEGMSSAEAKKAVSAVSLEDEAERSQPLSFTEQKHSVQKKPTNVVPETNKKSKKKKKKSKAEPSSTKSKDEQSLDSILEDLSIEKKPMQQRVNQSDRMTGKEIETNKAGAPSILAIDPKHLKGENKMRRIFGSKVVDSFENQRNMPSSSRQVRGVRRVAHNPRKTLLVSPPGYWPPWDKSISMDLLEMKSGLNYFRYTFDPSVIHVQELFEAAKAANDLNAIAAILGKYPYHPESLLTFAELFKYSGEHQSSADAVEKCLFALECAWHPLFSPLQGNYQLKYSHDINKPFFTALFSHMKNLDRRGCHRSALEVCKFLLSLDSDDPKGALFCIDYFALRSQQYKWLEQFAEGYQCDNSLLLFPNFSFSLAIARFFLERDATSEGSDHADKSTSVDLMKQALMLHPLVLRKIVDKAPLKDSSWSQILRNVFFGSAKPGSPSLEHMINIYVERHYIMWRFPELQNFLKESALLVIESLKQDNREAQDWACVRKEAFSSEKNEYSHLLVSDFSDTTPSLPPEELRPFMVGPGMVHQMLPVEQEAAGAERLRAPRDVAGRNPALVFLESVLPWVDYGDNHHDENDNDNGD